ncbi:acyl-CoA dehydrogenase, C-terminal domain protein [Aeromicrobium marinum DSM 15272]|uniref:Acyl-CoA dehydrogenase, C-terminal domain protein n=1 Tax=Aeromicrobium marinum DSM 15272 TaxID=585531 RepID=E2S8D5_9ACTN|nr:acyl-CoA dehydrogenase family protein [Aeromicrobium marinum]EFQ84440.1 acyl-CoA dehydrogenase, C-terminal domain protein [Aeromicrobium marinum DSM 15272]
MDFTLDTEQLALADAVKGLLSDGYDRRNKARESDSGYDAELWSGAADMGLLGLPFAEEHGGVGAGATEVMLVAERIGRTLAPIPFVDVVVLAGGLVSAAGTDDQKSTLLEGISSGEHLVVLAHTEPRAPYGAKAYGVTASGSGDDWTLSGVKEPVSFGGVADTLLVTAVADGATRVFVVAGDASGLTRTAYPTHDGRKAARIELDGTPAVPLGDADESAVAAALDLARVALAAEAVGAMAEALTMTTEYLKSRKQFGVPLKTFQALTFRAADMYTELELARSAMLYATMAADAPGTDPLAASRAALQVSGAARLIGQEAIQLHGGIAMTDEYAAGHYTSRLTAIEHTFGDRAWHLARLTETIDDHDVLDLLR